MITKGMIGSALSPLNRNRVRNPDLLEPEADYEIGLCDGRFTEFMAIISLFFARAP